MTRPVNVEAAHTSVFHFSFSVSNGKTEPGETCEELVREVEGNGVFSQLSLEVNIFNFIF